MNSADFLYPHAHYRGLVKPENLVFNANLQEFAQRVGYLANLTSSGKLRPEDSYQQIEKLWQELEVSKDALGIES